MKRLLQNIMSYLHALILHRRARGEHQAHLETIVDAVAKDQYRKEIRNMGKTAAEALIE